MQQTKLTPKHQTTVPKHIRKVLGVTKGKEIEWHVIKNMVVVDAVRKIKGPIKFLTSQTQLDLNMVDIVRNIREER